MKWLALLLLVGVAFSECNPLPPGLPRGASRDWNCRIFTRVREHKAWFIEVLSDTGKVKSKESVDCSRAVYDPVWGQYSYWPKSIDGAVWCPAYAYPNIAYKLALRKRGIIPDESQKPRSVTVSDEEENDDAERD